MGDLVRTVKLWALSVDGEPGESRNYVAIVDTGATMTVVPRKVLRDLDHKLLGNQRVYLGSREVPVALLLAELEGDAGGDGSCEPKALMVAVSDAEARKAGPKAEVILGHDYLQRARAILRFTSPHRVGCVARGRYRD